MSAWREQAFRSKAKVIAWLALLMVIPGASDSAWLSGGSSGRKRVFSPGFVVLCVFVAVVELLALNHFYGMQ
ncbi:hypothetical protein C4C37_13310 [Pseudomonas amygdali pv. lachrymans]|uniref:Uncharacterized protein n=2 Tax=Pseudomonas amygdali pv. lachrymans TaxID=53707 RepID=A0AAD0PQ89_PSEAV|nr:hypothetical protein [Pseudomonas amygdali]AXH55465.1 hypothetical protein PLA107_009175 [Pseudomonas amygdali pv. lachrymans str. M301315]AXH56285.1 hypothetical protein PLA107_013925 [Pseudomonas amygdali pv. lachrymans str. M301315]KPC21750.1 Uncharacterized protein AC499_3185 [Pseudomonas amygdali pv. lachrymans]PWC98722.1 hypothetical protein CX658_32315 [Pseudomonas amygdali pv. lachrymans]PWC99993.1 hypothetical protein CX658_27630 [Pseudomonas amygdali pv. lachrymans]